MSKQSPSWVSCALAMSLVMAVTLLFSVKTVKAGDDNALQTDVSTAYLISFWDLRDSRKSFFQVTNTTSSPVQIHIQVWNAGDPTCPEFDYLDDLTPFDTHLYDLGNLDRNNGQPLAPPQFAGGHGIVAVTTVDPNDPSRTAGNAIIGNFSVVAEGFEYRTNSAGFQQPAEKGGGQNNPKNKVDNESGPKAFNFNTVDGSTLSDIVLFTADYLVRTLGVTAGIFLEDEPYELVLVDEHENVLSCPTVTPTCNSDPAIPSVIDFGINQLVVNSKGGPSLCLGTDAVGQVVIDTVDSDEGDFVIGFIGLNNGTNTGSMDIMFNAPTELFDILPSHGSGTGTVHDPIRPPSDDF